MLVLAALLLLPSAPQSRAHDLSYLRAKIDSQAAKLKWKVTMTDTPTHPPYVVTRGLSVDATLMFMSVQSFASKSEASRGLASAKTYHKSYVVLEEPKLDSYGLKVYVPDFSNKRISNMKTYAGSAMQILGVVGHDLITIDLGLAPELGRKSNKDKTFEQIYNDAISLAKFLAKELKKK